MPPKTSINASLCPLCGQENQCAMELGKTQGIQPTACWCASVKIDAALLEKMPPAARGLACICPRCAGLANASPPRLSTQPKETHANVPH